MSVIIINSALIFVIIASVIMGIGLICMSYKLGLDEEEEKLNKMEEIRKKRFDEMMKHTNLKK